MAFQLKRGLVQLKEAGSWYRAPGSPYRAVGSPYRPSVAPTGALLIVELSVSAWVLVAYVRGVPLRV